MDIAKYITEKAERLDTPKINGMLALSEHSGVSLAQLYRLRNGQSDPKKSVIERLGLKIVKAARKPKETPHAG